MSMSWPKIRLFLTSFLIQLLCSGPATLSAYFPNTAESALHSFVAKSIGWTDTGSKEKMALLWGFFNGEMFLGSITGVILCFLFGNNIRKLTWIRAMPWFGIVGSSLQLLSKHLDSWLMLVVGRFCSSVPYGINGAVPPSFLYEESDHSHCLAQKAAIYHRVRVIHNAYRVAHEFVQHFASLLHANWWGDFDKNFQRL